MPPKRSQGEQKGRDERTDASKKKRAKKTKVDADQDDESKAEGTIPQGWRLAEPTLLENEGKEEHAPKIAAFDLDGTLVLTKTKATFPRDEHDFRVYNEEVPKKLKALQKQGYRLVILSNQGGIKSAVTGKMAHKVMKRVDLVLKELNITCKVILSTSKDKYRKPETGMWTHLVNNCNKGLNVDLENSFYVGDAAGREGDFANTDKEFAEEIGLPFKTPEEMFGPAQEFIVKNPSNVELVQIFKHLSEVEKDGFKRRAFEKVSGVLMDCTEAITSGKQAMAMPGVGKGSAGIIDEFLSTGKVEVLEQLTAEKQAGPNKEEKAGLQFLD
mmetsp:Transcript_582/g.4074  ORF Transcript_582/g.4074 Transcript_582/m.4074 type:complete len:328 (-) Transcript_582:319-1302(-)